jgi:hypothetical protein
VVRAIAFIGSWLAACPATGQQAADVSRFLPNPWYRAGLVPLSAAIGDFDGDGFADVAVGREDSGNSISVFFGVGGGFLGPESSWPTGGSPLSVVSADLDADGFDDVVAVNNVSHDISVLLSIGDGTFQPETRYAVGFWPADVVVGDFDTNGVPDLAVANDGGRSVSILLGQGAGAFSPATETSIGLQTRSLDAGDLDGDGDTDLVTANFIDNELTILWGDGAGGFTPGPRHDLGTRPRSVTVADLDGDGDNDLAVANEWSSDVSVLIGDGGGGFNLTSTLPVGDDPQWLGATDLDDDGALDLVAANRQSDDFSLLHGNGDGTFAAQSRVPAGDGPARFAIGDLDGDGHEDLVAALPSNRGITTLFGDGFGSFRALQPADVGNRPLWAAVADLDGDTNPDLVTANENDDSVTVRLGTGGGAFGSPASYPVGDAPQHVAIDDFDGNEMPDVVVPNRDDDDISVLLGMGDGTFGPESRIPAGTAPVHVDTVDLDDDGDADLVVANLVSSDLSVFLGNGDGTFGPPLLTSVSHQPKQVLGGEFDGATRNIDLVVIGSGALQVLVLPGNGDGTFDAEETHDAGGSSNWGTVADFNGDGFDDLAVANGGTNRYTLLFGTRRQGFDPPLSTPDPIKSRSIAHGDFDGDGNVDLVIGDGLVAGVAVTTVAILLGRGDGTFEPDVRFASGDLPQKVNVADVDANGAPDVLIPASSFDRVSVMLHEGLAVVAEAGATSSAECVSPAGAAVLLDGSGSTAAGSSAGTNDAIVLFEWFEGFGTPGETLLSTGETLTTILPIGLHDVVLRTTTAGGDTDIDVVVHRVEDTVAPTLSIGPTPDSLWPPNHRLVDVAASIAADDACGTPVVELVDVISDEPDDAPGPGDGKTTSDIRDIDPGTPDTTFQLRAERDDAGAGRTYDVTYRAIDAVANVTTEQVPVAVPYDRNGVSEPLTLTLSHAGTTTTLSWTSAEGATAYNAVRGDLAALAETADVIDLGTLACVETNSLDTTATDATDPGTAGAFFFLVEFEESGARSGYGTVTAPLPRIPASGDCPD